MKITCSRRDDILRQRNEYDADYNAREARYKSQYNAFEDAQRERTRAVETAIQDALAECARHIQLDVEVTPAWGRETGVDAKVRSYDNDVFNENKALSWSWKVSLTDEGEVTKETSSWSGLQATTAEQLDSLEWALKTLKILNSMDWTDILDVKLPQFKEYVTEPYPDRRDAPNFDQMLMEADIEDAIGKPILIKGFFDKWYGVLKATPAQYKTYTVTEYEFDSFVDKYAHNTASLLKDMESRARNISKAKFAGLVKLPIETFEL